MKKKNTRKRSPKRPCKKHKKQHRIRNWPEYNQDLKGRGSVTLWLDKKALGGWLNRHQSGKKGASCFYSDGAIACVLTLQNVYHLPLRATVSFLCSLLELLKVDLPVPDYSTLSRRRKTLDVMLLPEATGPSQNLHLVVDSTGFKIYGEGEWKVRQHGWSKRRTWFKLHLGIDQATGQIMAATVTNNSKSDKEMLPELLAQVEGLGQEIEQVSGDGGYDYKDCYQAIAERGAKATIPPRRNARLHHQDASWLARNQTIERIRELQGRRRKDKARTRIGVASSGSRKAATIAAVWPKLG